MPESTPSELLSQAADLIRDAGADAQPGPWALWPSPTMPGEYVVHHLRDRLAGPDPHRVATTHGLNCAEADGRWIALLNPAVAESLEAWLRHEATHIKGLRTWGAAFALPSTRHAMAFARAVLGLEDTPEETP